jgi:hypothetical protein
MAKWHISVKPMKYSSWLPLLMGIFQACSCSTRTGTETIFPKQLQLLWEYRYQPVSSPLLVPTIDDNRILISGDLFLTALNFANGDEIWKEPLPSHRNVRSYNVSITHGQIFGVILRQGQPAHKDAISWDRTTGKELWKTAFSDTLIFRQFQFIDTTSDYILVSAEGGKLVILNHDGTLSKIIHFDKPPSNVSIHEDIAYISHASSANNKASGKITAVEMTSWTTKWEYESQNGWINQVRPIIESGVVFAGTTEGYASDRGISAFFALNSESGQQLWLREGIQTFSAVIDGDFIYINDGGGIHKLRKDNGGTVWYTNFESSGTAPIAYGYGHIYAPHSGAMRILNAETGEIVHTMSPPDGSFFWLVTADKGRIFAQSSSHLYAFAPWGHEEALE